MCCRRCALDSLRSQTGPPSGIKTPHRLLEMRSLQPCHSLHSSLTGPRCSPILPTPPPITSSLLLLLPPPCTPSRSTLSQISPTSASGSLVETSSTASLSPTSASNRPGVHSRSAVPGLRVGAAKSLRVFSGWLPPSRPEAPLPRSSWARSASMTRSCTLWSPPLPKPPPVSLGLFLSFLLLQSDY